MLFLFAHVLALTAFGQSLRWGQRRTGNIIGISAVNYVAASLAAAFVLALTLGSQGAGPNPLRLTGLGLLNGSFYFLCLLVMLMGYETAGIGITSAVISCGCVVPILVARVVGWEDRLLPTQWAAVALLPAAILLMRPPPKQKKKLDWKADLILLAAFLIPAASSTMHTAAARWGGGELPGQAVYTTAIFIAALFWTGGYAIVRREPIRRAQAGLGVFIGLINIAATVCLVQSVRQIGAAVFFPTAGPSIIILHLLVSWKLWKEVLTKRQLTGVGVAIAVIVLANIGR